MKGNNMQLRFSQMPPAQRRALVDVVVRGGLLARAFGPGYDGTTIHTDRTMKALARRGGCKLQPAGEANPTDAGRVAVIDFYGSLASAYLSACIARDRKARR